MISGQQEHFCIFNSALENIVVWGATSGLVEGSAEMRRTRFRRRRQIGKAEVAAEICFDEVDDAPQTVWSECDWLQAPFRFTGGVLLGKSKEEILEQAVEQKG